MLNSGSRGRRSKDGTGNLGIGEHFNQQNFLVPTVTRFAVTDGSYVDTDDTAVDTAGGQTIVLYGLGFAPGATVLVGSTTIGAVTFLDAGRLTFTAPALSSGSYTIYVTNATGGTGILVPGLIYSGVPTFTTAAGSLGSYYEYTSISNTIAATGDVPLAYTLYSGSLPTGSTINSSTGLISGTAPLENTSTVYSFTIRATDAQNQDSIRSFSLTINTDVVSFAASPANNTTYNISQNTYIPSITTSASALSGSSITYIADILPTGLSIGSSSGVISGTPTVTQSITTAITANTSTTSNRTAVLYLNWTISVAGLDANWKNTSFLLSANNSPVGDNYLTDYSSYNNDLRATGNTRPIMFSPYTEGYYSYFLSGAAGDRVSTANNSLLALSTGAFCIEGWTYNHLIKNYSTFVTTRPDNASYTDAWHIGWGSDGGASFYVGAGPVIGLPAGTIKANVWQHIVVSKNSGGTISFFVDGSRKATGTDANNFTRSVVSVGDFPTTGSEPLNGYISNLRIVKGNSVYDPTQTTITVPTGPLNAIANTLLLVAASNRYIDKSNNNFTLTRGNATTRINKANPFGIGNPTSVTINSGNNYSIIFNGTSDFLTIPSNTQFQFGTGDFTVETWLYVKGASDTQFQHIIQTRDGTNNGFVIQYDRTNKLINFVSDTSITVSSASSSILDFVWYHVAIVRIGTTLNLFLNGSIVATQTTSENLTASGPLYISRRWVTDGTLHYFNGNISNLRLLKGTGVYTGAFTPPAAPLNATEYFANTSLLIAQTNTIIDNSQYKFDITSTGNTKIGFGPFSNTSTLTLSDKHGSTFIQANSAIQVMDVGNRFRFPGDFTIEGWIYPVSGGTNLNPNFVIMALPGSTYLAINFVGDSYAQGFLNDGGSTPKLTVTDVKPVMSAWNHVAMVRSGANIKMYVNGVPSTNSVSNTTTFGSNTINFYVANQPGHNNPFYTNDIRVTNGTALYTAPFFPPTEPLSSIANTVLLTSKTSTTSNNYIVLDESGFTTNNIQKSGNTAFGTFSPFGDTWSTSFNGTSDYLTANAAATQFTLSGQNFTIEAWVNLTAHPTSAGVGIVSTNASNTQNGFYIYMAGDGSSTTSFGINAKAGASSTLQIGASYTFNLGTWYHIVLSKSGTSYRFFVNGSLISTQTSSATWTDTAGMYIGTFTPALGFFPGYISNLRVAKGVTVYTGNFDVPTKPLTVTQTSPGTNVSAISSNTANLTVLLTSNSNKFVDYSTSNCFITRTGTAPITNFSPFPAYEITPASYSVYFNQTATANSYMYIPYDASRSIGTGDFSIECWVNVARQPANYTRVWSHQGNFGNAGNVGVELAFGTVDTLIQSLIDGNSTVYHYVTYDQTGSSDFAWKGKWAHVVSTRQSGTFRLFVNGVLREAKAGATTDINGTAPTSLATNSQLGSDLTECYISNFRMCVGSVPTDYQTSSTANNAVIFTPPTSPVTLTSQGATNVKLLLCQDTRLIDNSTANSGSGFGVQARGNTKPVIQNPFIDIVGDTFEYSSNVFGSSVYFDGTGDNLVVPYDVKHNLSEDFTLETWFYWSNGTGTTHLFNRGGGLNISVASYEIYVLSTGTVGFAGSSSNTGYNIGGETSNGYITTHNAIGNTWNHVAITRSANTYKGFINGVQGWNQNISFTPFDTGATAYVRGLGIGGGFQGPGIWGTTATVSAPLKGYMSNMRIVKGQSLYANNFIPQMSPYTSTNNTTLLIAGKLGPTGGDVTRSSNMETANTAKFSSNNSPYLNNYSTFYDGTGDYMSTATNAGFTLGTGDFTIEFWAYCTNVTTTNRIFGTVTASDNAGFYMDISSGILNYGSWATTAVLTAPQTAVLLNTWTHIAWVRISGVERLYFNGILIATVTRSINFSGTGGLYLGVAGSSNTNSPFSGFISNFRIVKGTAVYTSAFTPPTSPLTAIANTVFLTSQSNRLVDNSNNGLSLTRVGNVKVSTFQPFANSNTSRYVSAYFPAKADYFGIAPQKPVTLLGGDFTVEAWVYPSDATLTSSWAIIDARQTAGGAAAWLVYLSSYSSGWLLEYYNGTSYRSTGRIQANEWTHIGVVRSGTTVTFYINGVASGTATVSGIQTGANTSLVYVGSKDAVTAGYGTLGYIADLRITNGAARTIIVPSVPYPLK